MSSTNSLRSIPSIDSLLQTAECQPLLQSWSWDQVVVALRGQTELLRKSWLERSNTESNADTIDVQEISHRLIQAAQLELERLQRPRLVRVLNATGVVLHTNMGRAPLGLAALERIRDTCTGYCNVELDLSNGQRGSRHDHISQLLCELCGCQSAVVVNNCAAAMMLIVDQFAKGKEVVVSRGELVEIGGAFRVPDVLSSGGATLVEVGTTNKTRIGDFARALTSQTSMLLSTHLSNFIQSGFVESPKPEELVSLGRQHGVLTCLDLGSGLMELSEVLPEVTVRQAVEWGFDLVAFSGDKLLGGPQAGIILGRGDLIGQLKKNPLMRALRVDKVILAALEGTLLQYRDPRLSLNEVPILKMLHSPLTELENRAQRLCQMLQSQISEQSAHFEMVLSESFTGGGSLPGLQLPTWAIAVRTVASEEAWATALRRVSLPVIGRRSGGALLLDVRTLHDTELELVVQSFQEASKEVQ